MIARYIQEGREIDYKNETSTLIPALSVIVFGTKIAVAACDIPAGKTGSITTKGVFTLKKGTEEIGAGTVVYYDASADMITTTEQDNTRAGVAVADVTASAADILVDIGA